MELERLRLSVNFDRASNTFPIANKAVQEALAQRVHAAVLLQLRVKLIDKREYVISLPPRTFRVNLRLIT